MECESLQKLLVQRSYDLKIANDRIDHLQNTNTYRIEVVRLQDIVTDKDSEIKLLKDEALKKDEKIRTVENSLTYFLNENTRLKSAAKLDRKDTEAATAATAAATTTSCY